MLKIVIAELTVVPLGTESTSLSHYVAGCHEVLKKQDKVKYRINRKTIGIIVNVDQELTVRAPIRTSIRKIKSLLTKKEDWILKKLSKMADIKAPPTARKEKIQSSL